MTSPHLTSIEDVEAGRYEFVLEGDRLAGLEMKGQEVYSPDGATRLHAQALTLIEFARMPAAAAAEVVGTIAAALPLKQVHDPAFPF
jgi:hypothetical protein